MCGEYALAAAPIGKCDVLPVAALLCGSESGRVGESLFSHQGLRIAHSIRLMTAASTKRIIYHAMTELDILPGRRRWICPVGQL